MSTPKNIVSIIEQHKKSGEIFKVSVEVIEFCGEYYYGASYLKGNELTGHIIVKEDGTLPRKSEIKEILEIGVGISSLARNFYAYANRLTKRNLRLMKKAYKFLINLKQSCKFNPEDDFAVSLERFINVPKTVIEQQEIAKTNAKELTDLMSQAEKKGVLTKELYEKMKEYQFKIGKALFNQNHIQMETYEDRRKVIRYLFKHGKPISATFLQLFHLLLHKDQVKHSDKEDFEQAKKVFLYGEELDVDLRDALIMARNPN